MIKLNKNKNKLFGVNGANRKGLCMDVKLTQNEGSILQAFEKHIELKVTEVEEITGIPKRTVQRILPNLVKKGMLQAHGSTRDRFYTRVYGIDLPPNVLAVFYNGKLTGELEYGNGEYHFTYNKKYTGPELPGLKKDEVNTWFSLFTVFENLIPENERREKLLFGKNDIAEVLPELNNAHGAFDFIPKEELYKYKSNYGDRPNWMVVKQDILGQNGFPNVLELTVDIEDAILDSVGNTEHSNLSGYQTKIDIDIDWKNHILRESKDAHYLLKPRNKHLADYFGNKDGTEKRYYPYIALNEHLFMSFAKNELDFNVPYTGIIKADKDFHYVTKRYDRYNKYKYDQMDFAQLLGVTSKDKYKSGSDILFKKINEVLNNKKVKMEALRFYYYSYLIKHADLHLKNIGALNIGQNKFILTPLYDVISVGFYKGDCDDLGLPFIDPPKKPVNWKMDDFYRLGKYLGLTKAEIKKEIRDITEIYIKKMPEYIERIQELEEQYNLQMQKTRKGYISITKRLMNLYDQKIISLKKLGILEELSLLEMAGGPLGCQKQ